MIRHQEHSIDRSTGLEVEEVNRIESRYEIVRPVVKDIRHSNVVGDGEAAGSPRYVNWPAPMSTGVRSSISTCLPARVSRRS